MLLRFVAGELGKSGRNLEQIGAKILGPKRFGVFFLTWRNAYLHVHDFGHIGKLETNLDSFKTALTTQKGYAYQKEIKGPRKVNTHAIIGK